MVGFKIVVGMLLWRSFKGFTFLDCKGTSKSGIDVGFFSVSFLDFFSGVILASIFFSGVIAVLVFFSGVITTSVLSDGTKILVVSCCLTSTSGLGKTQVSPTCFKILASSVLVAFFCLTLH